MDVWIGTSGFSYPDWVGDFYPAGTRPAGMLPYYAHQFPLVELNYTRHRPWATPETGPWLAAAGADLVAVDAPDLPGLFPSGFVANGPRAYVRLHSRNAENWYAGGADRYDYDYGDAELAEWAGALDEAARRGAERALLLFNNCHRSQAAHNARRMQELLRQDPDVRVV